MRSLSLGPHRSHSAHGYIRGALAGRRHTSTRVRKVFSKFNFKVFIKMKSYADTVKGAESFYEILPGFRPASLEPPRRPVVVDVPAPTSFKVIQRPSAARLQAQPSGDVARTAAENAIRDDIRTFLKRAHNHPSMSLLPSLPSTRHR